MRVLLIEDMPGEARLLREHLAEASRHHTDLEWAQDLATGLEKLHAASYDAVLLDLSLPDARGLDTLRRLEAEGGAGVAVVVLTGLDDEETAVRAVQEGAQDYLVKGRVDGDGLVRSLRYAVERKRVEQEREQLHRELERLRQEWSAVIAHDLRQPIGVIGVHSALLGAYAAQRGEEAAAEREAIRHIDASVAQLNRMVADLLDASRLEAGRMTLFRQSVDVAKLTGDVASRLEETIGERRLHLQVEGERPALAQVDPGRVEQVLSNLLSNAVKYGEAGSPITIRISTGESAVRVSITNRGKGMAPDELGKLFSRFHRTREAEAGGVPGLGLGLYICKGLVEAHGGRIGAESIPGESTTFWFTLPRDAGQD